MKRTKISKGFTLVEVLIAMSIISIITLAFFQVLNNTIRMNEKTEKDIQMMDIAQSKIENMLSNIRESAKDDEEIQIEINNSLVNLESLFNGSNTYSTSFEYLYEDGLSKYIVNLQIEREKVGSKSILDNCYLYHINYNVKEKDEINSSREVSLSTSILSLK